MMKGSGKEKKGYRQETESPERGNHVMKVDSRVDIRTIWLGEIK